MNFCSYIFCSQWAGQMASSQHLTRPCAREGLQSAEYDSFRSSVAQKRVAVGERGKEWIVYDAGPKCVKYPLIFLPPVSGGADVFYRQILALGAIGYRVISLDYPAYWSTESFCHGLMLLLEQLDFEKVHIFGASLGGYLGQCFAEYCYGTTKVLSLILCNSFSNTSIFDRDESSMFYWAMPAVLLKRILLGGFPQTPVDPEIAESIDIMVESLDRLSQSQLACRMTLNCAKSKVNTSRVAHLPLTILDVYDACALSPEARDALHKAYPSARMGSLKTGGNFPYLSRSAEVNTFIRIHLKQFEGTEFSPRECDATSENSSDNCATQLETLDLSDQNISHS